MTLTEKARTIALREIAIQEDGARRHALCNRECCQDLSASMAFLRRRREYRKRFERLGVRLAREGTSSAADFWD